MERHQPQPIKEESELRIGRLRLRLSRDEKQVAEAHFEHKTLFRRRVDLMRASAVGPANDLPSATRVLPTPPEPARPPPAAPRAEPRAEEDAFSRVALPHEGPGAGEARKPARMEDELMPLYSRFRESWRALHLRMAQQLGALPEQERAAAVQALQGAYPVVTQEPGFRVLAASFGVAIAESIPAAPAAPWCLRRRPGQGSRQRAG